MQTTEQKIDLHSKLLTIGISDLDAKIILDCIIAKKSCSWMNADFIDDKTVSALNKFITENNYSLQVKVDAVPTRGKFIWDVKALK